MSIITEIQGDLFDAPEGAALIHACNCQGSWGKGIAQVFRQKYPAAYQIFRAHYRIRQQPRAVKLPEGTALIIPPQPADYQPPSQSQRVSAGEALQLPTTASRGPGRGRGRRALNSSSRRSPALPRLAGRKHWIICLFTSWHYGPRNRSPPDIILENTMLALADLKRQIAASATGPTAGEVEQPGELWGCRFNAGLFGVPWERTREVLEEAGLVMTIIRPVGE
ncbi:ADP-ribose 1''-phosphate phosphatase [[Emmonsia] crescens]|uniref:ADP-ribose 1''-phosphate phosphatase n=1 Tax=[Emmonsia] crescens TaxID=73230 RepID=A0A0G2HU50_9EURO|nr:ADP-ribose 1''-phosphate phosphatase [Emmonsia crescens UAMH 3008]